MEASHSYFKFVPKVFSDSLNFDFADRDYELVERDRKFLRDLNEKLARGGGTIPSNVAGQTIKQEALSEADFERFIDCIEKSFQNAKSKQDQVLLKHFYAEADEDLTAKINQQFFLVHLVPYWKRNKRFTRKFWENPDSNDPDASAAFRKRQDPNIKMQLRRNEYALKKKLQRKK